jgi:oligopeptide/dipeptide ABC transporter ATP-binding protein
MTMERLIEVENLKVHFPLSTSYFGPMRGRSRYVRAVDGISFVVHKGETFSLVGETGSGKTTTARAMIRLIEPTSGRILFRGKDMSALSSEEMRSLRRKIQIVFQDPFASLNPRKTVGEIVGRPLAVHGLTRGSEMRQEAIQLLEMVGLAPGAQFLDRYPHEFSGGQRQRIGVARALALKPELIVLDEPVSSLDISIRSQILNLLQDLRARFGLAYVLIAHDLSVVRYLSDKVAVMYLGKTVEIAESESLFINPKHPYTKALLASIPIPDPSVRREKIHLRGEMPSPINVPTGCRFHPRCPQAKPTCRELEPALQQIDGHLVACHM